MGFLKVCFKNKISKLFATMDLTRQNTDFDSRIELHLKVVNYFKIFSGSKRPFFTTPVNSPFFELNGRPEYQFTTLINYLNIATENNFK